MVFNLESFIIKLVDHPLLETWYNHLTKSLSISFLTDFAINQSETTFLNFRISTISIVPINFRKFSHIWLNFSGIFCLENLSKRPKLEKLGDEISGPLIGHPISAVIILCIHFFETEFDRAIFFNSIKRCSKSVILKSDGIVLNRMVTFTMSQVHVQWSLLTVPLFYHFRVKMTFWSLKFQFGTNIFIFVHPCISIHSVNIVK